MTEKPELVPIPPVSVTESSSSIKHAISDESDSQSEKQKETKIVQTIYLIRHAQSTLNLEPNKVTGQSKDTPLSEEGKAQAGRLGKRLKIQGVKPDLIFSSSADRAIQTAKLALAKLGVEVKFTEATLSDDLLEQEQGDFEGKERGVIYTPEIIKEMECKNMGFIPPKGESLYMVQDRAMRWLKGMLKQYPTSKTILVFTHCMLIRSVVHAVIQNDPRFTWTLGCDNTSLTKICHQGGRLTLQCMNSS